MATKGFTAISISELTRHTPIGGGVYFLLDGDEVVYVGQSLAIASRVASHVKDKVFTSYCFIPLSDLPGTLMEVEMFYIDLYRPKYNSISTHLMARSGVERLAVMRLGREKWEETCHSFFATMTGRYVQERGCARYPRVLVMEWIESQATTPES